MKLISISVRVTLENTKRIVIPFIKKLKREKSVSYASRKIIFPFLKHSFN